jgi:2-polyprenyl-6-methoxyphenol hydroxylase-like FAD-dependent oxidoreductase
LRRALETALGLLDLDGPVRDIATPISSFVMQRMPADEAANRGIPTEYGKRLVQLQDTGAGIIGSFEDGSRAGADILAGADGIRSMVRSLIDPSAPQPRRTGLNALASFVRAVVGNGRIRPTARCT